MHASPSSSSTEPLQAVVIGAGRRGRAHAQAALQCGVSIRAVCDPDRERAEGLVREVGGRATETLDEALSESADVALITSPPPLHAEQTIAALRSGCTVILEKPIALCMGEAYRIGEAIRETGRQVYVCQQQRYTVAAERAREALNGKKAALVHIWLYRQAPDIRGNWDRNWGGGHIVEWAIHPIDFCRYVLGDVESVYAAYTDQVLAGTESWANWDGYSCTLRFANGAVGSVATSYACWPGGGGGFGLDFVAEGMVIRWRGSHLEVARPNETITYPEPVEPTLALHRAVYHTLRTGDPSPIRLTYPDAVRTQATVLACNRSNETGLPVRVADLLQPD